MTKAEMLKYLVRRSGELRREMLEVEQLIASQIDPPPEPSNTPQVHTAPVELQAAPQEAAPPAA